MSFARSSFQISFSIVIKRNLFLIPRRSRTKTESQTSYSIISGGVPQCAVLSPQLFLLFMKDSRCVVKCEILISTFPAGERCIKNIVLSDASTIVEPSTVIFLGTDRDSRFLYL